jgi:tetratricopeptide (TPR) repeat protein
LDTLGLIQLDKKMWNDAIETYRLLVNRFPFATGWLKSMGLCYLNVNQLDMARKYYEEVVQYDELDADAWVDLGNVYAKLGHKALAFSAFQRGLKYDWLNDDARQKALQSINQLGMGL